MIEVISPETVELIIREKYYEQEKYLDLCN
jgi:hypothetical protein